MGSGKWEVGSGKWEVGSGKREEVFLGGTTREAGSAELIKRQEVLFFVAEETEIYLAIMPLISKFWMFGKRDADRVFDN